MTRPTITSIGEVLIDFVSTATGSLTDSPGFVKTVGGEGANVAVGLAKLGSHSVFIGKVGADSFGRFLVGQLKKHHVDVRQVMFDEKHKTRLAFVSLEKSGNRDFEFWEKIPAGEQLQLSEINLAALKKSRIVNIAPLLLMKEPARTTALQVARELRKGKTEIAFDANVRLALWHSAAEAKRVMLKVAKLSTILRLNDDEARFLTAKSDVQLAARSLRKLGAKLLAVTLGANGCYFQTENAEGFVEGFKVKAVDTTGCGDAFFAALLHGIAHSTSSLEEMSADELNSICVYANAVGALTSLKRGGAEGVPYPPTVIRFLKANA
jgi:sugar/nucleoside kinase (ribokinase family)